MTSPQHPRRPLPHRWRAYLLAPVDGASVAAFRFCCGAALVWEVARYFAHGWVASRYVRRAFHFTYPGLDFLRPWPGGGMTVHFALLGVLAACVAVGFAYRVAAPALCLAFTYVFLLDRAYYLNHFYLLVLFTLLLAVVPAHRALAVDRRLWFPARAPVVPRWAVFILRAQVFLVYFYGGLAKLDADWLGGEPMRHWLADRADLPLIGAALTSEAAVWFFVYGGLIFDLAIGFLLCGRRTRALGFGLAALFHLLNARLFPIGIFPYLMFAATLVFATPDWPRQLGHKVVGVLGRCGVRVHLGSAPASESPSAPARCRTAALVFVHLYLLVQVAVPLRHLAYADASSWTGRGQRFAWHMMLEDRVGVLRVYATDPVTGRTWEIDPADELTPTQLAKAATHPELARQYARHVADRLSAAGRPRPAVGVDLRVGDNGRRVQPVIDPDVNLAEDRPLADWVLAFRGVRP